MTVVLIRKRHAALLHLLRYLEGACAVLADTGDGVFYLLVGLVVFVLCVGQLEVVPF